jgi:peptidoglycan hydrolase-like protein with peptidoglycan-binding domain
MSAQKALVRLGYVLRADGVFGVTTRQAIERYERDNKLPVRGELTPKLARELVAKSGLSGQ